MSFPRKHPDSYPENLQIRVNILANAKTNSGFFGLILHLSVVGGCWDFDEITCTIKLKASDIVHVYYLKKGGQNLIADKSSAQFTGMFKIK